MRQDAEPVANSRLFDDGVVRVYRGEACEVLNRLRAESVDCRVTSPPYWGLRHYVSRHACGTGRRCADTPGE